MRSITKTKSSNTILFKALSLSAVLVISAAFLPLNTEKVKAGADREEYRGSFFYGIINGYAGESRYGFTSSNPNADPAPDIDITPSSLDFDTEQYTHSQPKVMTVSNNGTADLNIGQISIIGQDAENFRLQSDNCSNRTIAPGNSESFQVIFLPDANSLFYATVSIPSDDPDENPRNLSLSGVATRSSYTDLPVNDEEGDQEKPAISWDRVVWHHGVAGFGFEGIHMYDLTTGVEIEISASGTEPDIWGDRIVWQDNAGSNIYMYDLLTGNITNICVATGSQKSPAIWGDRVVWEDTRNGNYDIYMYDLSTEQETAICTDGRSQRSPAIWGDYIVWVDGRNDGLADGNSDIYLYDLSTETEIQITSHLRSVDKPAVCGDNIVWIDRRNGNDDLYMFDISTGEETAVCTEIHKQDSPAISEYYIVWTDWRGSDKDIYLYEIETGAEIPLCTEDKDQITPAICGHRVVWEDLRNNPYDWSFDGDIFSSGWIRSAGADVGISMTDLTDPVENGYYLTYVLEVTNYGPSAATGVIVTDTLPAGSDLISIESTQGTCAPVGDTGAIGNLGTIPAGNTAIITLVVQPGSTGIVTNEATVEANESDFLDFNNTAAESTRISNHGIVRAAGYWSTRVQTSVHYPPIIYPSRHGAWMPSLTASPDGDIYMSYTRQGSTRIVHPGGSNVYVFSMEDIYNTSTASAWFHKDRVYEGHGTTILGTPIYGSTWNRQEARWSAIATDDAGNQHIAYVRYDTHGNTDDWVIDSSYHLMYVNNISGAWSEPVQVAEYINVDNGTYNPEEGGIWDVSLVIDSDGKVHITYMNTWGPAGNNDLIYITNQSGSWVSEVLSETVGPVEFNAYDTNGMVLDADDHVHIAFYSYDIDGEGGPFYLTNAPSGTWNQPELIDPDFGIVQGEGLFIDIAVDTGGNPHISYVSNNGTGREDIYYATKQGGTWNIVMVDEGANHSYCNSIAVDGSGDAHIAYFHTSTDEIRYATSASSWQPETIDDDILLEWSGEYVPLNDIVVDTQGRIHIVFTKNDFIYHATRATEAADDIDHDGVLNTEEQGPDGLNPAYDGDSSGTADYDEGNTVSVSTADGTYYVTLTSGNNTLISNFQTVANPSSGDSPGGVEFPFGFFDFNVYGVEPGGSVTIDILLPPGSGIESYYLYGSTSDNLTPRWYQFAYDGETGAEINGDTVTLHLVDGGRGDSDAEVNGVIHEPGGPSIGEENSPPAAPVVDVTPDLPETGDNLVCTVTVESEDADGDNVTYTYRWYRNSEPSPVQTTTTTGLSDTLLSTYTSPGDTWKCVVTPNDGTVNGTSAQDEVTVAGETTPGDANGDNEVNVSDITKVAKIILRIDSETLGADANEDGVVNVLDITKIARMILGLD